VLPTNAIAAVPTIPRPDFDWTNPDDRIGRYGAATGLSPLPRRAIGLVQTIPSPVVHQAAGLAYRKSHSRPFRVINASDFPGRLRRRA
jgi:hypothetical protein